VKYERDVCEADTRKIMLSKKIFGKEKILKFYF
jgi:hypothetical protein